MEIRRKSLAVLLGVAIAGIVGASAASLDLTSKQVGAGTEIVGSCAPDSALTDDIVVSYGYAYDAATQKYEVSSVTLSGIPTTCFNQSADIALADGTTQLGSASGSIDAATETFTVSAEAPVTVVDAELLDSVSVVIGN